MPTTTVGARAAATCFRKSTQSVKSKSTHSLQTPNSNMHNAMVLPASIKDMVLPSEANRQPSKETKYSARDADPETALDRAIDSLEEEDSVQQVVRTRFNLFCGCAIAANAVVIALETDLKPDEESAPMKDKAVWIILESGFCLVFLTEIIVRVYWDGLVWFRALSNIFDTGLVVCMVLDTWIIPLISSSVEGLELLPILRFLRLLRLIRLLRILKFCRGFYAMLSAFMNALKGMMWVCMMMVSGLFLASMFTTNMIGKSDTFKNVDMGGWSGEDRFGTVVRSMYSLFELMTLEGWQEVGRPLVDRQPYMCIFLFVFIMVFTFGLVNMIVAMVVEATLNEAKKLEALSEKEAKLKMARELRSMRDIFLQADTDNDGLISLEEFEIAIAENVEIRKALKHLGIPLYDARELFIILDTDGSGTLKVTEFINGCSKVRNFEATNWDTIATHGVVRSILHRVENPASLQDIVARRKSLSLQRQQTLSAQDLSGSVANPVDKVCTNAEAVEKSQLKSEVGALGPRGGSSTSSTCATVLPTPRDTEVAPWDQILDRLDTQAAVQNEIVRVQNEQAAVQSEIVRVQTEILHRLDGVVAEQADLKRALSAPHVIASACDTTSSMPGSVQG